MAPPKPGNIINTVNQTQRATSSTVTQATIKLTDETKRHVSAGIALHNILLPELQGLVETKLKNLYDYLVKTNSINTANNSLMNPLPDYGFDYREPRNNPKNYIITSYHELAKLFLSPFMTHFTKITDGSFEASAALTVIEKAKCGAACGTRACICFSLDQKNCARKVKQQTRNKWAHVDYAEWTSTKYLDSFLDMEKMANALPSNFDKVKLVQKLDTWKFNGLKLMQNHVDEALIKGFVTEIQKMSLNFRKENTETKKELADLENHLQKTLQQIEDKQNTFEEDQVCMNGVLMDHDKRLTKLENQDKSSSPLFSNPPRNTYFTGRESYIKDINEALSHEGNQIVTIQGLGGVGKTSLAVEVTSMASEDQFPGGIYWVTSDSGSGDSVLKASISRLARRLKGVTDEQSEDMLVDALTHHLINQERCLLVIDNVDSERFSPLTYTLINGMWVNESKVSMILTSRLSNDILEENITRPTNPFTLDCFSLTEGVDFLGKKDQHPPRRSKSKG